MKKGEDGGCKGRKVVGMGKRKKTKRVRLLRRGQERGEQRRPREWDGWERRGKHVFFKIRGRECLRARGGEEDQSGLRLEDNIRVIHAHTCRYLLSYRRDDMGNQRRLWASPHWSACTRSCMSAFSLQHFNRLREAQGRVGSGTFSSTTCVWNKKIYSGSLWLTSNWLRSHFYTPPWALWEGVGSLSYISQPSPLVARCVVGHGLLE